ncbi:DNA ligase 1 [Bienertia sinuspersici]
MVCIAKLVKDLPKGWDDVSNPSSSFFVKPTFDEENCWKAFQYALGNGPSKCSLRLDDYGWDEDFLYVSDFMQNYGLLMINFPKIIQEVVDYCSINESTCFNMMEEIVKISDLFFVPRDEFCTDILMKIYNDEQNLKFQDDLINCWKQNISVHNEVVINETIEMVFIPVLIRDGSSGHFVLYVLDLNKHIIYYLDNKVFVNVTCYKEKIERISSILADQLSSLFENLNLVFDIDIGLFPTKEVKGDWKKGATDLDCAVYVMVHMLFFYGSEHFNFEPLNDEKRRKVRPEILDKVISFRDKRLSALEEIYVNRSKREEAQKIEEEKRRKLEDLKGKEAQSFAKEGGEQQGEDGKNPRRSTRGKTKK